MEIPQENNKVETALANRQTCVCSTSCPSGQAFHKAPNHISMKAYTTAYASTVMHRQTLLGGRNLATWNDTAQFVDQQPTDAADLKLTHALPAHMDVVRTFKGSGFTTTGNNISSYQNVSIQ